MSDDVLVLTTVDNPHNPKVDYDKWSEWDVENGYNTESYIARLIVMEGEDFDLDDEIKMKELTDRVVRDILDNDVLNVYVLV